MKLYPLIRASDIDPREECDCITSMIGIQPKYAFPKDLDYNPRNYSSMEDFEQDIIENEHPVAMKRFYIYDHSQIALSLKPFNDPWDSGIGGVVLITPDSLEKFGVTPENAESALISEFNEYAAYVMGNLWEISIYSEDDPLTPIDGETFAGYYDDAVKQAESLIAQYVQS